MLKCHIIVTFLSKSELVGLNTLLNLISRFFVFKNLRPLHLRTRATRVGDLSQSFFACSQKIDTPESFILLLLSKKLGSTVTFFKGD